MLKLYDVPLGYITDLHLVYRLIDGIPITKNLLIKISNINLLYIAESALNFTHLAHDRFLNESEVKNYAAKWVNIGGDIRKSRAYKYKEKTRPDRQKFLTRPKKNKEPSADAPTV
jgi:hypothetical protein